MSHTQDSLAPWNALLARLDRQLAGGASPVVGRRLTDCDFIESAQTVRPLLTWGIFNPFGPTVKSLSLVAVPDQPRELIYLKMSNPFSQTSEVCGLLPQDAPRPALLSALAELFGSDDPESRLFQCAPSFVLLPRRSPLNREGATPLIRAGLCAADGVDLQAATEALRRHWLKPFDRAGEEVRSSLEGLRGRKRPGRRARPFTDAEFEQWLDAVTDAEHVQNEWEEIHRAWNGAILFRAGFGGVCDEEVLGPEAGLAFHRRLVCREP